MQKSFIPLVIGMMSLILLFSGCQRTNAAWEDTKSIGRYLHRQGKLLWSKDVDSKMLASSDEFQGPQDGDFIPLKDEDLKMQYTDYSAPQPKQLPLTTNNQLPNMDQFKKPSPELATIFQTLHFNTDQSDLRNNGDASIIANISRYLKANSKVILFVEGHCDERASESYNLALGTRRSNSIRNLLIKTGVNHNQVHTVSYGKEMPLSKEHNAASWAKNRRVEFKIYIN